MAVQGERGKGLTGAFASCSNLPRSSWNALIDEWIFSERDRNLLKRKLLDGITQEQAAEEFELSVSQVKRIVNRGLNELIKHL
jgi:DNA invertase Pin-like site-specific DNA recombinase